jgi:hypothetical protein
MVNHFLPETVWIQLPGFSSGSVGPNVRVIDPSGLAASGSRVLFLLGNDCPVWSSDRV